MDDWLVFQDPWTHALNSNMNNKRIITICQEPLKGFTPSDPPSIFSTVLIFILINFILIHILMISMKKRTLRKKIVFLFSFNIYKT